VFDAKGRGLSESDLLQRTSVSESKETTGSDLGILEKSPIGSCRGKAAASEMALCFTGGVVRSIV